MLILPSVNLEQSWTSPVRAYGLWLGLMTNNRLIPMLNCFLDGAISNTFVGMHMNKMLMGIFYFPSVTVRSHWLMGNSLCIEDSGGSSVLLFTQWTHVRRVLT